MGHYAIRKASYSRKPGSDEDELSCSGPVSPDESTLKKIADSPRMPK
jgi:hypothetical protein